MKILLDTCVWGGSKKVLIDAGHDAVWSGDWPEDPGDTEILSTAFAEKRILITLDKDFGELAIVYEQPHSGIVRLVNIRARQQANICLQVLEKYGDELLAGAIVTAESNRLRIRPPSVQIP